jgi:tight adherence protein B
MEILIGLGVFLFTLLLIHQGYYVINKIYKPEQRKLQRRLKILSASGPGTEAVDILKKKILSELPWLNDMLLKASSLPRLERILSQAGTSRPLGFFVILSVLLFFSGFLFASVMRINVISMVIPSFFLATTPFFYLVRKKKKRMEKFERQLPEALELVARALKAGHAFTGGLKLVAEEFGDPVGVEFGKTVDEINFGMAVPDALMNLTQRVECEDLKFFVVAVIVQRETGGNLADIFDSLGRLIRERFKFQGRVRVLSAEGKMSATVLVGMPFFLVGILSLLNPEYINVLFFDPLGPVLIVIALTMMGLGTLMIKKLIAIKV